ncbi:UbiA prenyltransferase family protein [Micromonospora sp. NPDC126480]|uniref:UbiA prenyltransferase family protein n=1 Tax=Micromonospora sp. NPDC126480 TaxID=3155312 RepID=UPI00331B069E
MSLLDTPAPVEPVAPPPPGRGVRAVPPLRHLIAVLRPGQWPKNLLVVPLPLLDAPSWNAGTLGRVAVAVLAFTVAASLVYVVNDITDRHRDRLHPAKRHRPIAAGSVPVPAAVLCAVALAAALAALVATSSALSWWPVLGYLLLNAVYSGGLKHVPLVDVLVVAAGFVLRLVQGYLATGHPVAGWLMVCVLSLCLVLILGKRRHEAQAAGAGHRPALRSYPVQFLDQLVVLSATLTVVTYLMYLHAEARFGPAALLTAPCALFAVFRYLQVVLVERGGGDPVRVLLRDRATVANVAVWGLLLVGVAVLGRLPA